MACLNSAQSPHQDPRMWFKEVDGAQYVSTALSSRRKARQLVGELQRLDACGVRLRAHWVEGVGIAYSCPDFDALAHIALTYPVELELLLLYTVWTQPGTPLVFDQPAALGQLADLFGLNIPQLGRVHFNAEVSYEHGALD